MENKIGVVGLWHLGCTLSACWSDLGYFVTGYDPDSNLIKKMNQTLPPIYEPGLNKILEKNIEKNRLKFTTDLKEVKSCSFVFLAYDTPVLENDESDLTPLNNAIKSLATVLNNGAIVIVSSQTPVGTCGKFRKILQTANPTLELVYSPENIRLGEAFESYLHPGRIILGAESSTAEKRVKKLFQKIPAEIISMNLSSAEMVKHGINSFLALSITFANQLADLCEQTSSDILDVIRGIKSDPRIGLKAYLSAGIGFSGGTLGRDLKVLEKFYSKNRRPNLFKEIYRLNFARADKLLKKLNRLSGNKLRKKRIGILGLTYKPGTSTLRRSLPVEIVKLISHTGAQIAIFDPKADYNEWKGRHPFLKTNSIEELVKESEIVILLTEWPEFRSAPWNNFLNIKKPQLIFDTKNFLSALNLEKMGYHYVGTGRKVQNAK